MPLQSGSSRKQIEQNIRELIATYGSKGKIGNVHPKSKKHAMKIATAIAMHKAGKSR
jgi:hypothetical protein